MLGWKVEGKAGRKEKGNSRQGGRKEGMKGGRKGGRKEGRKEFVQYDCFRL